MYILHLFNNGKLQDLQLQIVVSVIRFTHLQFFICNVCLPVVGLLCVAKELSTAIWLMKSGTIVCSVCHSKLVSPSTKSVSQAYDRYRSKGSSKQRAANFLLVGGDCVLVGLQPILVYMSKVDGKFKFSPISVNFLTEVAKVLFAIVLLILQGRKQKAGEKPLLSISAFIQVARCNLLLAVPALFYAINNYLKFIMQLYFNPATVKMLSNLKVLFIAVLLKIVMKRKFSIIQWEALSLLLIGITINQLRTLPEGSTALGIPIATRAYLYTLVFVTVPSMASIFNEYALKSQYDTSIYLQVVATNHTDVYRRRYFQAPDADALTKSSFKIQNFGIFCHHKGEC